MAAPKRTTWSKIGKFISAFVIVCFFLPFFGVSCDGMDVITISGADMVGGCKPGGLIAAAENEGQVTGGTLETKIDKVAIEPFAIGALTLVLVVFGLSFVSSKTALRGTLIASILAIGLLVALYLKINGDMTDAVAREQKSMEKSALTSDVKVSTGGRFGLWIVGLGLLSILGLTASAILQKPEAMPPAEPVPPAGA